MLALGSHTPCFWVGGFADSSDDDTYKSQCYSTMTIQTLQGVIHPELVSAKDIHLPLSELSAKMRAKAAASDRYK